MQAETLVNNLKRTIAGKEMLLETYRNPSMQAYPEVVRNAMIQFLEVNLAELRNILADAEVALTEYETVKDHLSWSNAEIRRLCQSDWP